MQLAVVAADFTGGEADQLRRAMGAWRRKGELERYRDKLLQGMADNGYDTDFAARLCRQIEGFGSYGFPESHAASFALLVYASAWLKCFEPAAFLCGLLNSQPMGFYSPSQLIQDARRHGVEVRAPDVNASERECTLEAAEGSAEPAVRLGLRMVRGLHADAADRIAAARAACAATSATAASVSALATSLATSFATSFATSLTGPSPPPPAGRFATVEELATLAALDAAALRVLATAGALASIAGHRRQALWQAAGGTPLPGLLASAPGADVPATLAAPSEGENLRADYARLGFTLGRHPLALIRGELATLRFLSATDIAAAPDRMLARSAGLVTCRQRPGTAKGTMFITLEDETGLINVIVRPELLARQRRILLGARLLGIYGQISRQGSVVHLQASRAVDHSALLGALDARSRDFH